MEGKGVKDKKAIVALSGGVDSSVAAALLKEKGFTLTGVFMRFSLSSDNSCCSPEAEERARDVARILQIPFYVLDLREKFSKNVVNPFLFELSQGETPNPCTVCNREIKFKTLLEKLVALNADYVATGHYARLRREIRNSKSEIRKKDRNVFLREDLQKLPELTIFKPKDKEKDQTYFLWRLKPEWLKRILFPLSELTKSQVRKEAEKRGLPTFSVSDSQEICFVGDDYESFLQEHLPSSSGKIKDTKGNILGEHKGLMHYTLGQRKGLGISGGPYYVLKKDKQKNELTVTKKEKDLEQEVVRFTDANFLQNIAFPLDVEAKIRYRAKPAKAKLHREKIIFSFPQRAVTPGQSVVFYKGEEMLGGAVIK